MKQIYIPTVTKLLSKYGKDNFHITETCLNNE